MLQDRFRKKTKRPTGGGSPLEAVNIAGQAPQIDDVLANVDDAIQKADKIQKSAKGHWEYCCGVRRWVED